MVNDFGPWATMLDTGPGAGLGTFWKRRIAMLPFAKQAGQKPSGRAATVLILFALFTLAAPMLSLSLSPAAAPAAAADSASAPPNAPSANVVAPNATPPSTAPAEPAEAKLEKLPDGSPLEAIPVPDKPNMVMRPVGLAEVTAPPLVLDGSFAIDPYRVARVRARFPGEVMAIGTVRDKVPGGAGEVVERDLRPGDRVTKGQLLAKLWSKDVGEKKSDLVGALSQLSLDRAQLDRLEKLQAGVIPQSQMREAEHKVETDQIAVDRIERTLRSWRLSETEIAAVRTEAETLFRDHHKQDTTFDKTWAEVDVRAPFDGTILERNATASDLVGTDLELFKIADLSKLAVVANVSERDAYKLRTLSPERRRWEIYLRADPKRPAIAAYFDTIGDTINASQATTVTGIVDNVDGLLRPGLAIRARIVDSQIPGWSGLGVPSAAILAVSPGNFIGGVSGKVWIQTDAAKPAFELVYVVVQERLGGTVIIQIPARKHTLNANGVIETAATPLLHAGARVVVWGQPEPLLPGEVPAAAAP